MKTTIPFAAQLERWEKTARALGAARRLRLPSERRLDLSVAQQERELVLHLYKETFGFKLHRPKLSKPKIANR